MSGPFDSILYKLDHLLEHIEEIEKDNTELHRVVQLIYEQNYKLSKENKASKENKKSKCL